MLLLIISLIWVYYIIQVDQPIAGSVVITRESSSDPVSAVLTNDYSWIYKVLQPGKKLYDGHGVARPSAFVGGSGQQFIRDLEVHDEGSYECLKCRMTLSCCY